MVYMEKKSIHLIKVLGKAQEKVQQTVAGGLISPELNADSGYKIVYFRSSIH